MRTGIRSALKHAENVLIRNARRNAWAAVCENRKWAEDRERATAALTRSA